MIRTGGSGHRTDHRFVQCSEFTNNLTVLPGPHYTRTARLVKFEERINEVTRLLYWYITMQYVTLKVPLQTTKQSVRFFKTRENIIPGFVDAAIQGLLQKNSVICFIIVVYGTCIIRDKPGDLCVQRGPVGMGEKKMRHFF